jgi:asparagine synthase (glutamine-hydrolysing)
MLPRLRGMFALVVWDRRAGSALIARDPYGIKPLYVARIGKGFLVASQVKGLLASGLVDKATDPLAQAQFWMLGSVAEPHSWYAGIQALPVGSWARIDAAGMSAPVSYWDIGDSWRNAPPCTLGPHEVAERVRAGMRARQQQRSG